MQQIDFGSNAIFQEWKKFNASHGSENKEKARLDGDSSVISGCFSSAGTASSTQPLKYFVMIMYGSISWVIQIICHITSLRKETDWRLVKSGRETKGGEEGKGGSYQPSVCFQSPFFSTEVLSGLRFSVTIVSLFPAFRKAQFDLINIQLPSHSKKAHYTAKETDPWQVSGK